MDSILKKVGTMQVIYTIEPDPADDTNGIMTLWTQEGAKLASVSVRVDNTERK